MISPKAYTKIAIIIEIPTLVKNNPFISSNNIKEISILLNTITTDKAFTIIATLFSLSSFLGSVASIPNSDNFSCCSFSKVFISLYVSNSSFS